MRDVLFRRLRTELWLLAQYLLISFVAVAVAYESVLTQIYEPPGAFDFPLISVWREKWGDLLRPWGIVSLGLSAIRIAIVLFAVRFWNHSRAQGAN